MQTLYCFGASRIRADYSHHVLRAMQNGFTPVSLSKFVAMAAHAFYINAI
jgi:hypothetical protein